MEGCDNMYWPFSFAFDFVKDVVLDNTLDIAELELNPNTKLRNVKISNLHSIQPFGPQCFNRIQKGVLYFSAGAIFRDITLHSQLSRKQNLFFTSSEITGTIKLHIPQILFRVGLALDVPSKNFYLAEWNLQITGLKTDVDLDGGWSGFNFLVKNAIGDGPDLQKKINDTSKTKFIEFVQNNVDFNIFSAYKGVTV